METKVDIENMPKTQSDTRLAKAKPVKLGWSTKETDKISEALNELLANYQVHYQKLRNYHWNVKGGDFFDLHEEFETLYTEAQLHIDEIAERIRVFDKTPLSTLKDYLEHSQIKETGTDLEAKVMTREVISDFSILIEQMSNVAEVAMDQHDSGSEQMMKGFVRKLEKHHWMLTAFMAK